jgi:hypothetical protein
MDLNQAKNQAISAFFVREIINFGIATFIAVYSFRRSKKTLKIALLYMLTFGLSLIAWPICKLLKV